MVTVLLEIGTKSKIHKNHNQHINIYNKNMTQFGQIEL